MKKKRKKGRIINEIIQIIVNRPCEIESKTIKSSNGGFLSRTIIKSK